MGDGDDNVLLLHLHLHSHLPRYFSTFWLFASFNPGFALCLLDKWREPAQDPDLNWGRAMALRMGLSSKRGDTQQLPRGQTTRPAAGGRASIVQCSALSARCSRTYRITGGRGAISAQNNHPLDRESETGHPGQPVLPFLTANFRNLSDPVGRARWTPYILPT